MFSKYFLQYLYVFLTGNMIEYEKPQHNAVELIGYKDGRAWNDWTNCWPGPDAGPEKK